jgi:homoserine kinase type II
VALFTALAPDHLDEICALYRIGRPLRTSAIAAGTINSNFSIQTERGRYFLRVNEGKSIEDVAWEAHLVEWLASQGFATPAPLQVSDGSGYLRWRDKLLTLFPWSRGRHLSADEVTVAHATRLGQTLGHLHRLGLLVPATGKRQSVYDQAHLRERFADFEHCGDKTLAAAIALLRTALDQAEQMSSTRNASVETVVHGDLFRDNVLWDGETLVAVLDFEQSSAGTVAYDLAVCLNDWCWNGAPVPSLVDAVLDGYQRERDLSAADRRALPIEVRAAAMRFTITRITDVYLAQVDNPDKDFRDFLARLQAWQTPLLGEFLRSV